MKKKGVIFGFLAIGLFLGLIVVMGQLTTAVPVNVEAMEAANNLYAAGHYGEAAQLYEQMAAQGVEDAALFYNLGNAYYQLGDRDKAAAQYAHAADLAPRDADIQANLELAGGAPTTQSPFADMMGWMTLNETAVLAIVLWFVFGAALLAILLLDAGRGRKVATGIAVVTFVILLAAGALLGSHMMVAQGVISGAVAL